MNTVKLSGVVITYNEELKIASCITSLLKVCDEVIVLDSYSTDKTVEIATLLGAKIFYKVFEGHIQQKNHAISLTSSPYILSLDADEELSTELIISIKKTINNWTNGAYSMKRLNHYNGQWIRHGAWYPDIKLRLWDSRLGQWGGENPHDKFLLDNPVKPYLLSGNLLHYTMDGYEDLKNQTYKFSKIAAKSMHEKGVKTNFIKKLIKTVFRFIKEYLFLLGFLDGLAGFHIALMNAKYVWLKHTELQKNL